jgi:hypothetical protein
MVRSSANLGIALVIAMSLSSCHPTGTPANCTYTVQLAQHVGPFRGTGVPAGGGDFSVDVVKNPYSCPVPTYTSDSWITITQEVPDRGLGFRITAAANTGGRRTGTGYVAYQALTVDQAGTSGSACTFQLIPASSSFTSAGGPAGFVVVPSDQHCGWKAERSASGEDWSDEPNVSRGLGTMGITFAVKAAGASQPSLPRQAEVRVMDSAGTTVGSFSYNQQ